LFESIAYGHPAYAQLSEMADASVFSEGQRHGVTTGAEDGSEMGAFCVERSAVKEQAVLSKYEEYLPLGLTPVIVPVT
jgi:hypothetical protein